MREERKKQRQQRRQKNHVCRWWEDPAGSSQHHRSLPASVVTSMECESKRTCVVTGTLHKQHKQLHKQLDVGSGVGWTLKEQLTSSLGGEIQTAGG